MPTIELNEAQEMLPIIDLEFERAVRHVTKLVAKLVVNSDSKETRYALCRALRTAKLKLHRLEDRYGGDYIGSPQLLRQEAKKAVGILVPAGRSKVVDSIRRHEREMRKGKSALFASPIPRA